MNTLEKRFKDALDKEGYSECGLHGVYAKICARVATQIIQEYEDVLFFNVKTVKNGFWAEIRKSTTE